MKPLLTAVLAVALGSPPLPPLGYCWRCGPGCGVECPWSVYYPTFTPVAPESTATINASVVNASGGPHSHVLLAVSPNGSALVLQQAGTLLVSRDAGNSWSVLTAWPQPRDSAPGGVAILSDGVRHFPAQFPPF